MQAICTRQLALLARKVPAAAVPFSTFRSKAAGGTGASMRQGNATIFAPALF